MCRLGLSRHDAGQIGGSKSRNHRTERGNQSLPVVGEIMESNSHRGYRCQQQSNVIAGVCLIARLIHWSIDPCCRVLVLVWLLKGTDALLLEQLSRRDRHSQNLVPRGLIFNHHNVANLAGRLSIGENRRCSNGRRQEFLGVVLFVAGRLGMPCFVGVCFGGSGAPALLLALLFFFQVLEGTLLHGYPFVDLHHGGIPSAGFSQDDDPCVVVSVVSLSLAPRVPSNSVARKGQLVASDDADDGRIRRSRRSRVVRSFVFLECRRQADPIVGLELAYSSVFLFEFVGGNHWFFVILLHRGSRIRNGHAFAGTGRPSRGASRDADGQGPFAGGSATHVGFGFVFATILFSGIFYVRLSATSV